jgi:hypothetical protein
MLRRETKILLVGEKREGATLGFWERVVRIASNSQIGAKDGFFSHRRAV